MLTHAHAPWILDAKVCRRLRIWNAKCLSNLTGKSIGDECRCPTWDLIGKLRSRRLKWAGKILAGEDCLLRRAVEALAQQVLTGVWELDGTLLMDCVEGLSFGSVQQLRRLAGTEAWGERVNQLDPPPKKKRQRGRRGSPLTSN